MKKQIVHQTKPAPAQKGAADGWTNEKPAMEGAYWIRGNDLDVPALIQVKMGPDELECNLHISTTETDFWYGYTIAHLSDEFEWLGPLHPADDAEPAGAQDERDQLAAQVDYYRSTLRNVLKDIRDDLVRGGLAPSWGGVAETIAIVLSDDCPAQTEQQPE